MDNQQECETVVIENQEDKSPSPARQVSVEAAASDDVQNEALKEILERIQKIQNEIATFRQANEENWNQISC